jgi:hypothetical protein
LCFNVFPTATGRENLKIFFKRKTVCDGNLPFDLPSAAKISPSKKKISEKVESNDLAPFSFFYLLFFSSSFSFPFATLLFPQQFPLCYENFPSGKENVPSAEKNFRGSLKQRFARCFLFPSFTFSLLFCFLSFCQRCLFSH